MGNDGICRVAGFGNPFGRNLRELKSKDTIIVNIVSLGNFFYIWQHITNSFNVMRKIFVLALVCLLVGCSSNTSNSVITDDMSVREIVEKNVFIDMTLDDVMNQVTSRGMVPGDVSASFRAAQYRFMRSVSYSDKAIGSSSAKCGADLNMSEEIFKYFMDEMEFINNEMRKGAEKGNIILVPQLTEEYFNKLLEG